MLQFSEVKKFIPVSISEFIGCTISWWGKKNDMVVFGEVKQMSMMQFSEINKYKPVSIGEVIGCTIFWWG